MFNISFVSNNCKNKHLVAPSHPQPPTSQHGLFDKKGYDHDEINSIHTHYCKFIVHNTKVKFINSKDKIKKFHMPLKPLPQGCIMVNFLLQCITKDFKALSALFNSTH